jgi:hypothetical protein
VRRAYVQYRSRELEMNMMAALYLYVALAPLSSLVLRSVRVRA